MRKIIVLSMISLDGVMQAPGGPKEDTSGGFKYGGKVFVVFSAKVKNKKEVQNKDILQEIEAEIKRLSE
jgi:hypothetical protein